MGFIVAVLIGAVVGTFIGKLIVWILGGTFIAAYAIFTTLCVLVFKVLKGLWKAVACIVQKMFAGVKMLYHYFQEKRLSRYGTVGYSLDEPYLN